MTQTFSPCSCTPCVTPILKPKLKRKPKSSTTQSFLHSVVGTPGTKGNPPFWEACGKSSPIAVLWYVLQLCTFGPSFLMKEWKHFRAKLKGWIADWKSLDCLCSLCQIKQITELDGMEISIFCHPFNLFMVHFAQFFSLFGTKWTFKLKVNFVIKKALVVKLGKLAGMSTFIQEKMIH